MVESVGAIYESPEKNALYKWANIESDAGDSSD